MNFENAKKRINGIIKKKDKIADELIQIEIELNRLIGDLKSEKLIDLVSMLKNLESSNNIEEFNKKTKLNKNNVYVLFINENISKRFTFEDTKKFAIGKLNKEILNYIKERF